MKPSCPTAKSCWWREHEVWILVLFVSVGYFTQLGSLTIRGEESRRICIAEEMLATGDWIVPREQGQVFADPTAAELVAGRSDLVDRR